MMNKAVHVTESFMPPKEEYFLLVKELWESKHLTNRGNYTISLESEIQLYLNSKNKPLIVSNGTIAIQLAIKALNLTGEIITTPFSYIATTSSIVWENCKPIFVDIDPVYLTIDENKIEQAITSRTSAILATHIYGNPCNVEKIDALAKKYNLKVIYDAAHCFNVKYKNRSLFDYGDISTCSFHATKLFHTCEGGAVFCSDAKISESVFYKHNFGHSGPGQFEGLGINGKISELHSAMGLAILPHLNAIIKKRKKITELYNQLLNFNTIEKLAIRPGTDWNFSYCPIIFKSEELLIEVMTELEKDNIFARRYFYPSLNLLEYVNGNECPISESISLRILCLPMASSYTETTIKRICSIISKVISL